MPADAAFLKDVPLFQHMDDDERAAVAALMREVRFPGGAVIFREGEASDLCYVVRSGEVELSVKEPGRDALVVDVLQPGEILGELSLLDGGTRSATATAVDEVEAVSLDRAGLLDVLRRKPDAALDLLTALSRRLRKADEQLKRVAQNPNVVIESQSTLGERLSDMVASFGGSWTFVIAFSVLMAGWISGNALSRHALDPFPFILLNLVLSTIAALQAPIIMMSQNRQDAKDRIRSEADFEVNVKAHVAILELHEKIDRLEAELKRRGLL